MGGIYRNWAVQQYSGGGGSSNSTLLTGLISYWKLDEFSDASGPVSRIDSVTATGNDLTDNNTVPSAVGLIGNCGNFLTANSEYLSTTSSSLILPGSARSLSLWWNLGTSLNMGIVCNGFSPNIGNPFLLISYKVVGPKIDVFDGGAYRNGTNLPGGTGGIGQWVHIVYTKSTASDGVFYINAVSNATWNAADNDAGFPHGVLTLGSGFPTYATGQIDEVGLWNLVLTPVQVTALYNGGLGITYPFTGVP